MSEHNDDTTTETTSRTARRVVLSMMGSVAGLLAVGTSGGRAEHDETDCCGCADCETDPICDEKHDPITALQEIDTVPDKGYLLEPPATFYPQSSSPKLTATNSSSEIS